MGSGSNSGWFEATFGADSGTCPDDVSTAAGASSWEAEIGPCIRGLRRSGPAVPARFRRNTSVSPIDIPRRADTNELAMVSQQSAMRSPRVRGTSRLVASPRMSMLRLSVVLRTRAACPKLVSAAAADGRMFMTPQIV